MSKTYLIASLVFLAFKISNAQNAEYLYKEKYSKIGLIAGFNRYFTHNQNSANYYWPNFTGGNFGIEYNFHQNGNLNLKTSVLYLPFEIHDTVYLPGLVGEGSSGPYSIWQIPIESEYYLKLTDKAMFALSAGFDLSINPNGKDKGSSGTGIGYMGNYVNVDSNEYSKAISTGLSLGTSYDLLFSGFMLKINAKYHYNFSNFWYRGVAEINSNGVISTSLNEITGNYLNIGVTFVPKKRIFKKN